MSTIATRRSFVACALMCVCTIASAATADEETADAALAQAAKAEVKAAARDAKHAEKTAALLKPKAFDRAAYAADPDGYCATVDLTRVWQTAAAGSGAPPLAVVGPALIHARRGKKVTVSVRALPDAPVTFYAGDLGAFANGLTGITVRADRKDGIASARFTATEGTSADVNILASSPLCTGQATIVVNVEAE